MKILVVSSYLPFPLYSGGHVRLYNILKRLSRDHDITLVCEKRVYQTDDDVVEVKKFCKNIFVIPRKKQWSFSSILKTGFSASPFLLTGHYLPEMKKRVGALLEKEEFDLIHAETFYIAQNIPKTTLPVLVSEHNIEYLVYKRFVQRAHIFLKPFIIADVFKLRINEENAWKNASAVITVSNQDKEVVDKYNIKNYLVPNGVDLDKFKFYKEKLITNKEKTVLFIGDFKWVQNKDAVEFILKKVWPVLKLKVKNEKLKVKLWIVGKNIPENLKNISEGDVIFDENAPDETSEIFKKADILLAPIRIGGGTSYKILESMASGVPVVTTTLGAIGIGAKNKEEIIIADSEKDMIEELTGLLEDRDLYSKIASQARKLVEEKYNWDVIVNNLESVYKKIL